jgi:hypothetical protein
MPALPVFVRSRDFRLTPEQAASLRPAGWRRLLAPLAGPRFAFAGPLGTGLATLGIAGFLVAGAAGMPIAGSAAAPQDTAAGASDLVAGMPAPSDARINASGATPGTGDAPAASEAPAASSPIEIAPASRVPAGQDPTGDGNTSGGGVSGANAASPGIELYGSGTGGGGPIGAEAPDPKTGDGEERVTFSTPDDGTAFAQALDAPVQEPPATTPLFVLATLMLAAGVVLGGLRLLARRAA